MLNDRPLAALVSALATSVALATLAIVPAQALESGAADPHHAVEEHSFDRTDEARRNQIEEPDGAWTGPTEPDLSGAVDTPPGVRRTPGIPDPKASSAGVRE